MLIVACVEWGNYLGRGAEYVRKLAAGVTRHMRQPVHFQVLTESVSRHWPLYRDNVIDDIAELPPGFTGWWNKIALFQPRMFPAGARILFVDLDSVITGNLDELVAHKGIIHLRDWGWTKDVYGSGIMVWEHGEHREIWERWDPAIARRLAGDQDWLTELGGWDALPAEMLRSYRYHCKASVPAGCRIVSFHGKPKPHEAPGWVAQEWRL